MKFELINEYKGQKDLLPERATIGSAGYDFKAAKDVIVPPLKDQHSVIMVPTGVKAKLERDQVLILANRSSNPAKRGLIIPNGIGVIDSDYYDNKDNEGQIYGAFINIGKYPYTIHRGDRICQGVVVPYIVAEDDHTSKKRTGGFGSTGKR